MLQLTTIFFLISFSLLAVLHAIAIKLFLYWHFSWLDNVMHLYGGAVVALGVYTLVDLKLFKHHWLTGVRVVFVVFFVAVVWELFELSSGITHLFDSDYIPDTASDLFMGVVGGSLGYLVASRIQKLR